MLGQKSCRMVEDVAHIAQAAAYTRDEEMVVRINCHTFNR